MTDDDLIVSKTDLRGHLTYGNDTFWEFSAADEVAVLGSPHNVIRHPDMPGGIFRLLWDRLQGGEEIFAFIVNRALDGADYWVLAHATPSRDASGRTVGYHSMRRSPRRSALDEVRSVYRRMREVEHGQARRVGAEASLAWLVDELAGRGLTYDQWVWSLEGDRG